MQANRKEKYISLAPTIETDSGCLEWQGNKNKNGYGLVNFNSCQVLAHRFVYSLLNPNEDMSDKVVLHKCDNPSCVNPNHLLLGTQQENVKDCSEKNRWGKTRYSKLTEEQAKEIKYSLLPPRVFTEKFNITRQLVSGIRAGRVWEHI